MKGGLTDAQFNDLLRVVREIVREEMRAEFEGRRPEAKPTLIGVCTFTGMVDYLDTDGVKKTTTASQWREMV